MAGGAVMPGPWDKYTKSTAPWSRYAPRVDTLKAYQPTMMERIPIAVQSGLQALGLDKHMARSFGKPIADVLSYSPVGAVASSLDAGISAARNPTAGGKALGLGSGVVAAALGAVPGGNAARKGADLAMDKASRMARAAEQGFGVSGYHGTAADIPEFARDKLGSITNARSAKAGVWLADDPSVASGYAKYASGGGKVAGITARADAAAARDNWDEYDRLTLLAEETDRLAPEGANVMPIQARGKFETVDMAGSEFMDVQDAIHKHIARAKARGFDGVHFNNLADDVQANGNPARHTVVFDPANIRSRFAKFDPRNIGSANLLGAFAVGGLAAPQLFGIGGLPVNETTQY